MVSALKVLRPRIIAVGAYAAYTLMGVLFLISPTPGLIELLGSTGVFIWNGILIVGGILALIGASLKLYWIEMIGLPGIITGLGVYGLIIVATATEADEPTILVGLGSVFIGSAIAVLGRLVEVRRHTRLVERIRRGMADG